MRVDRHQDSIFECNCPPDIKGFNSGKLDLVDATAWEQPTTNDFLNDTSMFGFVCCDLTPPQNNYHPVVQIKKRHFDPVSGALVSEKCENNLLPEDHKKRIYDTPTLLECLRNGYTLDHVYRFDKYSFGKAPWVNICKQFYVDKERTSGPAPSSTESGEYVEIYNRIVGFPLVENDRDAYVGLYNFRVPGLGDLLRESMEHEEWSEMSAQRQVYKTMNNCGWGKHCEDLRKPNDHVIRLGVDDQELIQLFQNVTNQTCEFLSCSVFDDGKQLIFKVREMNKSIKTGKVYIPAGSMVPAYGRLTLLKGLSICGERVVMCDTDSIIYKTSLNENENIPADPILGGWKEEKISKAQITGFVGFGPKSYSIKTSSMKDVQRPDGTITKERWTSTKLKGIQQTCQLQSFDYEKMHESMKKYLDGGELESLLVPQWGIVGNIFGKVDVGPRDYTKELRLMGDDQIKGVHHIENGKRSSKIYPRGWNFSFL